MPLIVRVQSRQAPFGSDPEHSVCSKRHDLHGIVRQSALGAGCSVGPPVTVIVESKESGTPGPYPKNTPWSVSADRIFGTPQQMTMAARENGFCRPATIFSAVRSILHRSAASRMPLGISCPTSAARL
jgi:hypothetical protein